MKTGKFITLEGVEGAGKSTAIKFVADFLREHKIDFIQTREPGGTEIAEKIRTVLLSHYQEKMHPATEMLLYFAGRAQHINQVILPALQQNKWVICDRFTDATYAYQGGGRGIPDEKIAVLENWVQNTLRPDCTLLLDVDPEIGMRRIKTNRTLDRFEVEDIDFFKTVRERYLKRAQKEPKRFCIIDANKSPDDVGEQIGKRLNDLLGANWH